MWIKATVILLVLALAVAISLYSSSQAKASPDHSHITPSLTLGQDLIQDPEINKDGSTVPPSGGLGGRNHSPDLAEPDPSSSDLGESDPSPDLHGGPPRASSTNSAGVLAGRSSLQSGLVLQQQQQSRTPSVSTMATSLVLTAGYCINLIDSFKDSFVYSTLRKTWSIADHDEPSKTTCDEHHHDCTTRVSEVYTVEPYLPTLPNHATYVPQYFNYELVASYSLLQHYVMALQHLSLDLVFYRPSSTSFMEQVDPVYRVLESLMVQLKVYMAAQGVLPDNSFTYRLHVIYRRERDVVLRRKRDFVFLRDTRAGLLLIRHIFQTFKP